MKENYKGLSWRDKDSTYRREVSFLIRFVSIFFCFYTSTLLFAQAPSTSPKALFEEGRALFASGDLDRAIQLFNQVLKINPAHSPSYLNLGMIFTRKKEMDQAIQVFGKAVTHDPGLLQGHLLLGQAYAAKKMWQRSETAFKTAITLRPNYAVTHYLLGLLYQSTGAPQKAIPLFKKVLSLGGSGPEVEQAKKRLEEFQKKAALFFDQAKTLRQRGDLEKAEKAVSTGLIFDAENPYALATLGDISEKKRLLDEAVSYFSQALEIKEDFFTARIALAGIYERQGKMDLAIIEYQTVLSNIPDKEGKEAIFSRRQLKQIGETPEVGRIVGPLLVEGTRLVDAGELQQARKEFMVVLIFLPDQVYAIFNLGKIAFLEDKLEEAVVRFQEAIEIDPKHLKSHIALGDTYERKGEMALAIAAYEKAIRIRPDDERAHHFLGLLLEKEGRIKDALEAYHKVVALPKGEESDKGKVAQGRIDFYEKRFKVDFSNTSIRYDSNISRSRNPRSEISSDTSFALSYFLKKEDRFRLPVKLKLEHSVNHRSQFYFIHKDLSITSFHKKPPYAFSYGYQGLFSFIGGNGIDYDQSFSVHTYSGGITKSGRLPSLINFDLIFLSVKTFFNPIFDSKRLFLGGSLIQNLETLNYGRGSVKLEYFFKKNSVVANDQSNDSHRLSLRYEREILPNFTGNISWATTYSKYRHFDSLALSRGQNRRRRNRLDSASLGLTYHVQPGISFFTSYQRQKSRSNLAASVPIDPISLESGQVASLGSYSRNIITFGARASTDMRMPYPRWSRLDKRLSMGLTTTYYRPSLKGFNKILGDPKRVITQDPNHLLPSNPDFLSEDRNLRSEKIGGSTSLGIEAEWEISNRHGLVFSVSEWQNASVTHDQVPLLLAATEDPIMVPRSARYNLTINQYFLSWRYSLLNDPTAGRLYLDLGLLGMAFTNLTMDSLLKVEENPVGNPFVSLGSSESRGRSFLTRIGVGGSVFIKSWFSVGLNVNYLWGSVRKLKVEREFRSDFRTIPRGLPGIGDSPCFRIAVADNLVDAGPTTFTAGETLDTIGCEGDRVSEGEVRRPLTLKLDGFEGGLAFRFHFGEGTAGRTAFERWMDWGPKEITQGPFAKRGLSTKKTSRLKVDGVIKNETAYRINEPVTFTKALTLFRLNTRYSFSPRYELISRTRAFYDAIYDLVDIDTISPRRFPNTVLTQLPQVPSSEEVESVEIENSREVQIVKSRLEMRELFLDIHYKKLDLRIGKQIVRWGVVPGSRVTDEINPFDFSEFILREVQDRFIPLMMLKADYFPGNDHFEFIWITEVVPHKPAPEGSEFEQFQILDGFVVPDSLLDSNLNFNPSAFKNSEVAGRMVKSMNGLEIGLTAFYTWDDFPASFRAIEGGRGGGFQAAPEVVFAPRMNRITTLGTTLSKSFGKFVLNSEYSYTFGKFFGTLLAVEDAAAEGTVGVIPALGELKRDFMKYAVGLDFPLFKTDFSVQFLQQYIPDWDPTILQDRIDTVAALFFRKSFMNERLITKMLTLYFINESDLLLRPVIETRLTDSIKTHFGADFFIGDRGDRVGEFDFIGFFKDSNRFYLETIYSF